MADKKRSVPGGAVKKKKKKPSLFRKVFWHTGSYGEYLDTLDNKGGIDIAFLMIVLVLLIIGLLMMYSASYPQAIYERTAENMRTPEFYFFKQLRAAAVGLLAMIVLTLIPYHFLQKPIVTIIAYVVCVGLLILVLVMGQTINGATRWLFGFQPSEVAKPILVVMLAMIMSVEHKERHNPDGTLDKKTMQGAKFWSTIALPILVMGVVAGLLFAEPHLSACIIVGVVCLVMMFMGGADYFQFGLLLVIVVVVGLGGMMLLSALGYDYIGTRFNSWLNTFDPQYSDETLQIRNSLIAIGSGGWFGVGFGQSRQKYLYLPEPQNDFIFAITVEELGFMGGMIIVLLFILLLVCGINIAGNAPDKFGMLLVTGLTTQLFLQFLMNVLVVTNGMPNTGVSLPFFSYGGTALAIQLAEVGLILNVSRYRKREQPPEEKPAEPEKAPRPREAVRVPRHRG